MHFINMGLHCRNVKHYFIIYNYFYKTVVIPTGEVYNTAMGSNLNTSEAAKWLGLKESTLRDWRCDDKGPVFIEISPRCIRYAMEDLIKWRNDRRHVPSVRAVMEDRFGAL